LLVFERQADVEVQEANEDEVEDVVEDVVEADADADMPPPSTPTP
jgi:transcriptional/translational regulatory protein YebC/TACO1